jgi:hypothetical protein
MSAKHLALIVGVEIVLAGGGLVAQPTGPARRDAESFLRKLDVMSARGAARSAGRLRTTVTEQEVNAYLRYEAGDQIPAGVVSPVLSILGEGRVSGRAIVDLDRVRQNRQSTSLFDPMRYLTGRLPVTASGLVSAANGLGQFQLESAAVAGIPIPKAALQQIVSYYSRTADDPDGFGLDDPVSLPAGIREIQVQRGQAVVVQ